MADNYSLPQTLGQTVNPQFDPQEYSKQQYRQQLGTALMGMGMQQPQGQMVSGHYVAPSWTQYAGGLANVLGGKQMAQNAQGNLTAMNNSNMRAMLAMLPNGQPQPASAPQQPGSMAMDTPVLRMLLKGV